MSGYTNFHRWVEAEAGHITVKGVKHLITGIYLINPVPYLPNSDVLVVKTLVGDFYRDERDADSRSADWGDLWQRYLAANATDKRAVGTVAEGTAHVH